MRLFLCFLILVCLYVGLGYASIDTAFVDELEHLLVDTGGYNNGGFKAGVTPCSLYNQGSQNLGRQSAAQWIRVAFHDFATANVALGTGGLDASIGFETNRDEDKGAAMNDSLTFFAPFVNKYVSMADLIALGVVTAVGACSGPLIPFKAGRVDSVVAGDLGVPEEFGALSKHIEQFSRAGMNQTEMIQLTACGHTLGSVHQAGFPDVVHNAETPDNIAGTIHLDDTFDVFDNHIAKNFISGNITDPLVTSENTTVRSDLRIFSSDNNATMRRLAGSDVEFFTTCTHIMSKMIDTVPKGVNLTPIYPISLKPVNIRLSIDKDGNLFLSGAIRLLSSKGFPENTGRKVFISYNYRDGRPCRSCITEAVYDPSTNKGSSLYGDTFYHLFSVQVDTSRGISSYTRYDIQDKVIWLPELSSITDNDGQITGNLFAAVLLGSRQSTTVRALLHTPQDQYGAKNPHIEEFLIDFNATGFISGSKYMLFSSLRNVPLPIKNMTTAMRSSIDVTALIDSKVYIDDFRKLKECFP
ncbi:heme peroxidase [Pyrrhoderma noxium]|uniref:Peroxidase n=1 Tax=Pyrrhoderma noxium TaxID=2282107 RepID=A0A286UCM7_9AGAM|nr:heme peroxidase [Pyrrhoderma noxium]